MVFKLKIYDSTADHIFAIAKVRAVFTLVEIHLHPW